MIRPLGLPGLLAGLLLVSCKGPAGAPPAVSPPDQGGQEKLVACPMNWVPVCCLSPEGPQVTSNGCICEQRLKGRVISLDDCSKPGRKRKTAPAPKKPEKKR